MSDFLLHCKLPTHTPILKVVLMKMKKKKKIQTRDVWKSFNFSFISYATKYEIDLKVCQLYCGLKKA